ncbi:MAG TPA: hypothetical protein VFO27_07215, partial [Bryobacteraceae bacterium]|nr:hypothetical protein [Bryobacteraceae bacterium]
MLSLAGREGFVIPLDVYLDEAGIDANSDVLTVAGYLAHPDDWEAFTREWDAVLKPTGVSCYHATDAQALQGEFKYWKSEQVSALCAQLLPIIVKHAVGISASVHVRDFEAAFERRPELRGLFPEPYTACVHWLVMGLVDLAQRHRKDAKYALVHEINDYQQQALESYNWVKKKW